MSMTVVDLEFEWHYLNHVFQSLSDNHQHMMGKKKIANRQKKFLELKGRIWFRISESEMDHRMSQSKTQSHESQRRMWESRLKCRLHVLENVRETRDERKRKNTKKTYRLFKTMRWCRERTVY